MAKTISYYAFDRSAPLECPCGWTGSAEGNVEYHTELMDVRCPECDRMLAIIGFPTLAQTEAAAKAGSNAAMRDMPTVEAIRGRLRLARKRKLVRPSQLPALRRKREVRVTWDFVERFGNEWTVLRCGRRTLWREIAFFEGIDRFEKVFEILRERYGERLVEVRPTPASELYLYGDRTSAPDIVERLNRSLGATEEEPER
ncbi:hypothetical protein HJD18_12440 [Thermoleophilia bacterium SCSIO 60948]|nr:hypothetical protein HJD18_12440 [Thermoleophilia bacterium SCSIO 60948]